MLKKAILLALLTMAFIGKTNAAMTIIDINVSDINGGAGFVGSADVNIEWVLYDSNAGSMHGYDFNVDIYYSTSPGTQSNVVVADLNLGDINKNNGYCRNYAAFGSTTRMHCEYTWSSTSMNSITDGNYYIDINASIYNHNAGFQVLSDVNQDTNFSFYLDNTTPTCRVVQLQSGKAFQWYIEGEESASEARGGQTTLYYSEQKVQGGVTPSPSYSTMTGSLGIVADELNIGTWDYRCYAVDDAGNTGTASSKKLITYPLEGAAVVVSGGGAAIAQAIQSIIPVDFGTVTTNPVGFVTANPLFVLIVAAAAYLLFAKGGKKRKRR